MPVAGRLRYLEARPRPDVRGRGALLLLHAFPLNARMWEPQLDVFAERGWHVVAPHFRGFGELSPASELSPGSDPNPTNPCLDDYAGDVVDLLDALHMPEAVVVGLSMGGYVALAMMRLAYRYIHALILADTRPQADTPESIENRARMVQLARLQGVAAVADQMVPKLVGDTTRRNRTEVASRVRSLILSNSVESLVDAMRAIAARQDSTPLLDSIHVPTLIVVGEEDGLTPPAVAELMHDAIAGSTLAIIPAAGHLPNLESPSAFNDALADFLEHRV